MTNKQTDCIASLLFSLAFLGTSILALSEKNFIVTLLGLLLALGFALISLHESK